MSAPLSIVICTYDRLEILQDCLSSVRAQEGVSTDDYELIIVNNYADQDDLLRRDLSLAANWKVITVPSPGLSIARNAGIAIAKGEWIGFVDDDALMPSDFLRQAKSIIDTKEYDCFGGDIRSWWKYPRPRWLVEDYGNKPRLSEHRITLTEGYNWGSNIFIKKDALKHIGGFPEYIGMKGKKIGYAAENIVQQKLREQDYSIGYDPDFYIDHLVHSDKLKMSWHIKAAYATARDGRSIYPIDYTFSGFAKTLRRIIAAPIKGFFSLPKSDYYWQNWYLDSVIPWAQLIGKLRAITS